MGSHSGPIVVFDMPRNRSHVFFRYLGTHPDVQCVWHPFLMASLLGPERIFEKTENFDHEGNKAYWVPSATTETYSEAESNLLNSIELVEAKGKIPVVNEHCNMACKQEIVLAMIRNQSVDIHDLPNPTYFPDRVFDNLTPVFLIRNPVFAVPSNYVQIRETSNLRVGGEDLKFMNCMQTQRLLFEHFHKRTGKYPPLFDGDDLLWRTTEVRDKLSKAVNLEPQGFSDTWQAVPEKARHPHPVARHFLQAINDSTGILRSSENPPDGDLDKAYKKWFDMYGQEVADDLRATVEQNMPHYQYLSQFKV